MAMHEIESLIELSVYSLDNSQDEQLDKRSLFFNLYRLQSSFDTGFTHFRVMDILIKERFVYTFPLNAHPAYQQHQAFFDRLAATKKFSFIYTKPEHDWDEENNPVAGYANFDHNTQQYILYCDAGSPLWETLVANGALSGPDAKAPEDINVFEVALIVTEAAGEQKNKDTIGLWYLLLPYIVMMAEQEGMPVHYKALEAILDIVVANEAIPEEGLPPIDDIPVGGELGKFCTWWYAPAKDLMQQSAAPEAEIDLEAIPFKENVEKSSTWYAQQVVALLESSTHGIQFMEDNGFNNDTYQGVLNKLAKALEYADKGLELAPGEPNLLMNKGSILMLQQQYEPALAVYDEALAQAPTNPYVHLNRAILFVHMDQIDNAKTAFERLLQLDPNNEFAQQWLDHLNSK
ncbi:tetratricopeptide repeat protein [Chitinophaga vietnamensis]|uniref:tetratricopeptide repeat protein n=1 Tax=Chitinophaga vietnamensis TaxID=2593957 RepID=UPI00117888B3|nr:tetratricopeptide repeat protein [Chitinophaga vietnamensis]